MCVVSYFDFGIKYGEKFVGLKILKFEEILKKFSCHTVMNIHIKDNHTEDSLKKIVKLIEKYDCKQYVYFMSGDDDTQKLLREIAPDITRCQGAGEKPWDIVERAIENGCKKLQFYKSHLTKEMVDKAHANGIICNIFWSDDADEAESFLEMGIDTILTNDYNIISKVLEK